MSLKLKEKLLKLYLKDNYDEVKKQSFEKNKKKDRKTWNKIFTFTIFLSVISVLSLNNLPNPFIVNENSEILRDLVLAMLYVISSISIMATGIFAFCSLAFRSEKTIEDYAKENLISEENYIEICLSKKIFTKEEMMNNSEILNEFKKEVGEKNFNYLVNKVMDETGFDLGNAYFLYFMFKNKDRLLKEKTILENKERLLDRQIMLINSTEKFSELNNVAL